MKKTYLYILFVLLAFVSCKKDDSGSVFGEKPDERLDKVMQAYSKQLTGSENGWKAFLYTNGEEAYSFLFNFTESNRVTMFADIDEESASAAFESSYRLKAVQQPSISFDTYSYIHLLADPDPSVIGGVVGSGKFSDFEFAIDSAGKDTIRLTGNNLGSKMVLVRATKAEADAYKAGALQQMKENADAYASATPFSFMQVNDSKYETIISPGSKMIALAFSENGEDKILTSAYSYTSYGIHLSQPFQLAGLTFDELFWNAETGGYYTISGTNRISVQPSTTPSAPLSALLGVVYSSIVVPQGSGTNPLPGTSPLFVNEYNNARLGILNGPYRLTMRAMTFIFNANTNSMRISLAISQGTANFLATYDYSYTKSADGVFRFTRLSSNGNASLITTNMNSLLKYIEGDGFKIDYFDTGSRLLGRLTSQQHSTFFFTGTLN